MKKKLLTLAVAGAFAAPALVYAQASTVNVYGRFNTHFENVKASGTPGVSQRNRVSNYGGSAIGFRGSEKLGGGLSAIFQVESNIAPDGAGTTIGSRNTGVGLRGDFGSVILGFWDAPYKQVLSLVSQTGLTAAPGITSIIANGNTSLTPSAPAGAGLRTFSNRVRDMVRYESPLWGGFRVRALYGANEFKGAPPGTNRHLWSVSAGYYQGPLNVAAAYERHKEYQAPGTKDYGWVVGGNFTFAGTTRVGLLWERLRYEPTTATNLRRDAWLANLSHRMGPHQIIGSYVRASNSKGNSPIGVGMIGAATAAGTGAQNYVLQYKYFFSKRTQLVGTYSYLRNKAAATYNFQGGGNPIPGLVAGNNPRAFGIGIDHRF